MIGVPRESSGPQMTRISAQMSADQDKINLLIRFYLR